MIEILCFIAGLTSGIIIGSIVCLLLTRSIGTLRIKNGQPVHLSVESWDVLRNKSRAYLKIVNDDDSQE